MEIRRILLFTALMYFTFTLFTNWQEYNHGINEANTVAVVNEDSDVPVTPVTSNNTANSANTAANAIDEINGQATVESKIINVVTDVYNIDINTLGGTIEKVELTQYPVDLKTPDIAYQMMQNNAPLIYSAQTGLIGDKEFDLPNHNTQFTANVDKVEMAENEDSVQLTMTSTSDTGVQYDKVFTFHRGKYNVNIDFVVINNGASNISAFAYSQFKRTDTPVEQFGVFGQSPSFTGGAIYTQEDKYRKISFEDFNDNNEKLSEFTNSGWVSIIQHYFVSAWLPEVSKTQSESDIPEQSSSAYEFYTDTSKNGQFYQIGYKTNTPVVINAGETQTISSKAYIGPKDHKQLEAQNVEGLLLTVDYGWLTAIASPLFWLLKTIHQYVQNWGWSIVILTIMIKLCFFPLSAASYKSMARMRKFTPRMQTLRERYKDDRAKLNQEMMKLYKEEKVNPMGGCLPMLVQIPVFIALYWALLESVELRQAPFIGWIVDLSQKDPLFVLPVLYGITMFITQRLNPQPTDPIQQKVMMAMPIVFSALFLFFPAGLVIYWLVNNILTICQQWYINKKYAE